MLHHEILQYFGICFARTLAVLRNLKVCCRDLKHLIHLVLESCHLEDQISALDLLAYVAATSPADVDTLLDAGLLRVTPDLPEASFPPMLLDIP